MSKKWTIKILKKYTGCTLKQIKTMKFTGEELIKVFNQYSDE